ncbi:MAG: ATP-binding protein [Alphaproteobacteria bacterium]
MSRDFALLSVFIVFILLLVSAWVTVETIENHAATVSKQMENEALRIDRALIVELENASYLLESLGRQIQASGPDNKEAIAQLFYSFAKTEGPKSSNFSWIDRNQNLIISSNLGIIDKPIDVSDRDYVKKSIAEPWKVHIGRPIMGRLSQKMVLPMSLGLTDAHGKYAGSVIVALDIQILTDDISRVLKDTGIGFAITNMALTLITETPQAERFFTEHFDINQLAKIDFTQVASGEYAHPRVLDRHKSFSYFERSSRYPFVIFVGIDSAYSGASIRALLLPRLFQLCVIALFLLFVLWTVRRRIIQPVMQLTYQASAVTRGERFAGETLTGPLEIEQLAYEIKRLYDYIEERRRVESELRLKNAELTRIKEAAQLTNQVKAEFFAYVGQELTEPAQVILDETETIKDQHFGPIENPKYLQHARDISEHAQQLLEMLADIKSISEAETGLLALSESDIDLGFILQKTVRIFREKNPGAIDVQLDVSTGLPRIRGDELRIKQMVLNILNASARHLNPGDSVRITSALRNAELSISFAYVSGPDPAKLRTVTPAAITSAGRSKHGLELALARLLIAMHQGSLEMKTTQDRTTTITVKFPAGRVV